MRVKINGPRVYSNLFYPLLTSLKSNCSDMFIIVSSLCIYIYIYMFISSFFNKSIESELTEN